MAEYAKYHLTSLAVGIGAATLSSAVSPSMGWDVLAVTLLGGYVGGLLPSIDDTQSSAFKTVQWLSRAAAVIVPTIHFIYRPTDLLLAIPLALFMVGRIWELLHQVIRRGGHTHSALAAVCLSLGVAVVAYLTAGNTAALPAFLASAASYLLHLFLEDLENGRFNSIIATERWALQPIGRGKVAEFYSIIIIGFVSFLALVGLN